MKLHKTTHSSRLKKVVFDDDIFNKDIEFAIAQSKESGRFDLSDYLKVKANNDRVRQEARDWLFSTIEDIVLAFNNHGARIKFETLYKKSIKYGYTSLTGNRLELKQGLRCFTTEVGWTQSIDDGVMKSGSLAFGRLSHFGFRKETEEIELHDFEGNPQWFAVGEDLTRTPFTVASLKRHFEVLLK